MAHYVIDRSKWVCKSYEFNSKQRIKMGESMLVNKQGRMCCIGFMCLQEGVDKKALYNAWTPATLHLRRVKNIPQWMLSSDFGLEDKTTCSPVVEHLICDVNDAYGVDVERKEELIKEHLKAIGHSVEFKGELFPDG